MDDEGSESGVGPVSTATATIDGAPVRASPTSRWWFPVALFVGVSAVLVLVVWLSGVYLPRAAVTGPPNPDIPGGAWLEGWVRWDAGWYLAVANDGYFYIPGTQSSVAFFPAYPLLLGVVDDVFVGDSFMAGMFVTWLCGLGVSVLFWNWCRRRLSTTAATTSLVLLLVFPYAWFFHFSIYADALFIVAILGAFTLLDADHPWLAGLVGVLATAARPVGLAVAFGLVVRALERRGALRMPEGVLGRLRIPLALRLDRLRRADLGVLASLGGLVAYCTYLALRFGDPLAFAAVQAAPGWEQKAGLRTWLKISFLAELVNGQGAVAFRLLVQALFTLGALLLVPFVVKRFGWGYAAYSLAIVALPAISTKDFQGMGRYLLAAFPLFAVAGDLLDGRPRARVAVVTASAGGLLLLTSFSARGYYLT